MGGAYSKLYWTDRVYLMSLPSSFILFCSSNNYVIGSYVMGYRIVVFGTSQCRVLNCSVCYSICCPVSYQLWRLYTVWYLSDQTSITVGEGRSLGRGTTVDGPLGYRYDHWSHQRPCNGWIGALVRSLYL